MAESWVHAQNHPADELAQLHYFSFKKRQPEGEIEFVITVKEFASRNELHMRFYAQADKEVNQRTAPFRPFGWGDSLLNALCECTRAIRQFPYEGESPRLGPLSGLDAAFSSGTLTPAGSWRLPDAPTAPPLIFQADGTSADFR